MQPGTVRPIEYEYLATSEVTRVGGLTADVVASHLGSMTRVGILRCVDDRGDKLTALCDASHLRTLLNNGEASEPTGMKLKPKVFPVVLRGWLQG